MGKKRLTQTTPDLFRRLERRRRRVLFLPRFLADESSKAALRGTRMDAAHEKLIHWADLEAQGQLTRKETALDASFLHEVFGALGYRTPTEGHEWELERSYYVSGVGTADGALGNFRPNDLSQVVAVIELKGANADLDRDKFNGRTPVQQCWDYLNALPKCPWGIVSNFVTTRLYHRDRTPLAYEEFHLRDLRKPERFREFYCLFDVEGLLRPVLGQPPRAIQLLIRTETRQREVGDELYDAYSDNRIELINHLTAKHGKSLESAVHIAQKILDRIISIAFCEDRGLLPAKCLESAYRDLPPFTKVTNPRWRNFLDLFHAIDVGHNKLCLEDGYDGGLFRHDPEVDNLELDDTWTEFFRTIGNYDFRDEVNVDVLGHLFERSITELERLRVGGLFRTPGEPTAQSYGEPTMPTSAERKRFGIYYTPPDFTRFLVTAAVGGVIDQRFADLRSSHGLDDLQLDSDDPPPETARYWRDCLESLSNLRVCDPACGSGAFLIQAYDLLEERYTAACDKLALHDEDAANEWADRISDLILSQNLYGVDLSSEAVEITQLALWIRSARPGRTLADLSQNILCGNSLVTDPAVDARAFRWQSDSSRSSPPPRAASTALSAIRPGSASSCRNASSLHCPGRISPVPSVRPRVGA